MIPDNFAAPRGTVPSGIYVLAGCPGFEGQVDAEGVLWTHGKRVGLRQAGPVVELLMGPGLSALERHTLAGRFQCSAEVGTIFSVHTYHPHLRDRIAYAALHSAFMEEANCYVETPAPRAALAMRYPPGTRMDDAPCLRETCFHGASHHDESGCSECRCPGVVAE